MRVESILELPTREARVFGTLGIDDAPADVGCFEPMLRTPAPRIDVLADGVLPAPPWPAAAIAVFHVRMAQAAFDAVAAFIRLHAK